MATPLTLDLQTFDVGLHAASPEAYADALADQVEQSWDTGADVVLLPEFAWLGLEPLVAGDAAIPALRRVAELFWSVLHPRLASRLQRPGKAAVVGSVPFWKETTQTLVNRAVIFADGSTALYQDKLHLTPWEKDFTQGDALNLWTFQGLRIATIICLDIEIPELAARLRGAEVDLILCPSATETVLGVERVDRCASARAVELGCFVAVSHLVGRCPESSLIDENIGRLAFYGPSQAPFAAAPRWTESDLYMEGTHSLRVNLDQPSLQRMRRRRAETNPALLGRDRAGIERVIPVVQLSPTGQPT